MGHVLLLLSFDMSISFIGAWEAVTLTYSRQQNHRSGRLSRFEANGAPRPTSANGIRSIGMNLHCATCDNIEKVFAHGEERLRALPRCVGSTCHVAKSEPFFAKSMDVEWRGSIPTLSRSLTKIA